MTKLLSVISGSITLVGVVTELTSSIIKLKNCWNQINDAPEDLKWLIRETEILSLIMAEIEAYSVQQTVTSSFLNNRVLTQSYELCRDAAEEANSMVKDLGRDMESSNRFIGHTRL
jgi:sensor histidine kinase YesM